MISIPLIATDPSACSYLENQQSRLGFVHPSLELTDEIYSRLIEQGFRRSGDHVYRPYCHACTECISTRLAVAAFIPSRNQKRCSKKNAQTIVHIKPPEFNSLHFNLYLKYQNFRHHGGGMADSSEQEYISFLTSSWCNTFFAEFWIDHQLTCVAIVDVLDNALSAVYTFFDPQYSSFSPGVYAILWQLTHAKSLNLKYVYLGYWIEDCQKMNYKTQYQPIEGFINKTWKPLT